MTRRRLSPSPLSAWLLCGTLDIVYAALWSLSAGGTVGGMLRGVAKGPFGDAAGDWGLGGALLGLVTHYAIMGAMIAAFFLLARHWAGLRRWPWGWVGLVYGLILYGVMNGIVLPLRFGTPFPPADLFKGAVALLPHIFFVGLPLAWLFARPEAR